MTVRYPSMSPHDFVGLTPRLVGVALVLTFISGERPQIDLPQSPLALRSQYLPNQLRCVALHLRSKRSARFVLRSSVLQSNNTSNFITLDAASKLNQTKERSLLRHLRADQCSDCSGDFSSEGGAMPAGGGPKFCLPTPRLSGSPIL